MFRLTRIEKKAQTAAEVAVFGAVMIFVIGMIVRQAMGSSYQQNQSLKAMRLAMATSFKYSQGLMGLGGDDGTMSHNTATILFVEDRLTADSAKYGAIDRTPYMLSASATHSRNLYYMDLDVGYNYDLPIYDVFVNGRHFPFTTARFRRVCLRECLTDTTGLCPADQLCKNSWQQPNLPCVLGDCAASCPDFAVGGCDTPMSNPPWDPAANGDIALWDPPWNNNSWDDNCGQQTRSCSTCELIGAPNDCNPDCVGCTNCTPSSSQTFVRTVGCMRLYTRMYNHPQVTEWCDHDGPVPPARECPAVPADCPNCNLTPDERFDLDRSGASFAPPFDPALADPDVPAPDPDAISREYFQWQWYLVMAFDEAFSPVSVWGGLQPPPVPTWSRAEGVNSSTSENFSVDVDADLKVESIAFDTLVTDPLTGVITKFQVLDYQAGDFDPTKNENEAGPMPGFREDAAMYSFGMMGGTGTYLRIREGRDLLGPGTGQFIRTTNQKDQIDLVERQFQLSNDTHRFCDRNGDVTAVGSPDWAGAGWSAQAPNPMEACVNTSIVNAPTCFSGPNIDKICMDQDPARLIIFVRSRIASGHGRKWVTPMDVDDYVDLTPPPGL